MTEDELLAIILRNAVPDGALTLDDGVTTIMLDDGTTYVTTD